MHIHRRTADVAGHTRRFIVIQPEELGPQPDLLLFFHGSHQSANVIRRFTNGTVDALADATNTLVVYPDGIGHHFNDTRADLPVRARELGVDDVAFSTFLIETGLDTGPVFGTMTERIRPDDTSGTLLDRLADAGAPLLVATMDGIASGDLEPQALRRLEEGVERIEVAVRMQAGYVLGRSSAFASVTTTSATSARASRE